MIEPHHNDHQIATYWCQKCQIPTTEMMCSICGIDTKRLITSGRLRPVFADEIEIMEALIGTKLLDRPSDFVFWRSGRDYYAAGRKVFHIVGGGWNVAPYISYSEYCNFNAILSFSGRRPLPLREGMNAGCPIPLTE